MSETKSFLDTAGRAWSDTDFVSFFRWLVDKPQRHAILSAASASALAMFRYRVSSQDQIEIWEAVLDQIYSIREHYDPETGHMKAYLRQIAKYQAVQIVRRRMNQEPLEVAAEDGGSQLHPEVARQEASLSPAQRRALRMTLDRLFDRLDERAADEPSGVTPRRLSVLRDHYLEGKRVAEISRDRQMKPSTVKKDLVEGRKLLSDELEN